MDYYCYRVLVQQKEGNSRQYSECRLVVWYCRPLPLIVGNLNRINHGAAVMWVGSPRNLRHSSIYHNQAVFGRRRGKSIVWLRRGLWALFTDRETTLDRQWWVIGGSWQVLCTQLSRVQLTTPIIYQHTDLWPRARGRLWHWQGLCVCLVTMNIPLYVGRFEWVGNWWLVSHVPSLIPTEITTWLITTWLINHIAYGRYLELPSWHATALHDGKPNIARWIFSLIFFVVCHEIGHFIFSTSMILLLSRFLDFLKHNFLLHRII